MVKDYPKLTDEIVTTNYEEIVKNGPPFLKIFPQMLQDANIAETFKIKKSQRNKIITNHELAVKERNINEFREQIFLHCGMNLSLWNVSSIASSVCSNSLRIFLIVS